MALRDNSAYSGETGRGTVAGLFKDYSRAEQAISELKAAGFSDNQIGLARADQADEFSEGAAGRNTYSGGVEGERREDRGLWDKIKGAFGAEDERNRYNESNYAYSDDFQGSLTGAGLPEDRARYFGSNIHSGGCLVTVNTSGGSASEAIAILERNGADIGSGNVEFGSERNRTTESVRGGETGERRIQLLGEMLRVHKERVSRGEVRLRKDVVSETKNIQVPVTREELVIERTDVSGDRPATGEIGTDREIRVPLSEERVRVDKDKVVTGEVRVGKRQVTENQTVSDEVRHEEVKVDKEGDVNVDDTKMGKKGKKIA